MARRRCVARGLMVLAALAVLACTANIGWASFTIGTGTFGTLPSDLQYNWNVTIQKTGEYMDGEGGTGIEADFDFSTYTGQYTAWQWDDFGRGTANDTGSSATVVDPDDWMSPMDGDGNTYDDQGEIFDVEGMWYTQVVDSASKSWHNILIVLSTPNTEFTRSGASAFVGDLLVNPTSATDSWGSVAWNKAGGNRSDLGVKLGGDKSGYTESNALWGYGYKNQSPKWNDPTTTTWGDSPRGYRPYLPGETEEMNGDGYSWGTNFVHGDGSATVEDDGDDGNVYVEWQQWVTDADDPAGSNDNDTFAIQVSISEDVIAKNGIWGLGLAPSCLNDSFKMGVPAPGLPAFALVGIAPVLGVFIRRRTRSR